MPAGFHTKGVESSYFVAKTKTWTPRVGPVSIHVWQRIRKLAIKGRSFSRSTSLRDARGVLFPRLAGVEALPQMYMNMNGQQAIWFVNPNIHWVKFPLLSQLPRPQPEAIWFGFVEVPMEISEADLEQLQVNRKTPLLRKLKTSQTAASIKLGLRTLSVSISFADPYEEFLAVTAKDMDSKESFETVVKSQHVWPKGDTELRNKSALVVQTLLRRRAAVKRVHREKVRSKGQMLPWKRTIANGDGWYMETNPNDGSDILIWCRRLPKWEIVFGPFPVSLVEDLIKQARASKNGKGGVGLAPLPGTQYGESGTYISANGDTAKYVVETRGSLKQNDLVSDWVKEQPEHEKTVPVRIVSHGHPRAIDTLFASPTIKTWKPDDIQTLIDPRFEDTQTGGVPSKRGLENVKSKAGTCSKRILKESIDKRIICSETAHTKLRQLILHLTIVKKPAFPDSFDRNGIPISVQVPEDQGGSPTISSFGPKDSQHCIVVRDQTLGRWYPASIYELAALKVQTFTRKYSLAKRTMFTMNANKAATQIQALVRGRVLSIKFVEEQRTKKGGMLIAVFGTLIGCTGWYLTPTAGDDEDTVSWFRCDSVRMVEWRLDHGPFKQSLVERLIKRATHNAKRGKHPFAALPGTVEGGSGAYIGSSGTVKRFLVSPPTAGDLDASYLELTPREHAASRIQLSVREKILKPKGIGVLVPKFSTPPGHTGWYMDQGTGMVLYCRFLQSAYDGSVEWVVEHGPCHESIIFTLMGKARLKLEKSNSSSGLEPLPGTVEGASGAYINHLGHVRRMLVNEEAAIWTELTPREPQAVVIQRGLKRTLLKHFQTPSLPVDAEGAMVAWMFTKFGDSGWYVDKKCEQVVWCNRNDCAEGCSTWDIEFGPYEPQYILEQIKKARILLSKGERPIAQLAEIDGQTTPCHIGHTGRIIESRLSSKEADHVAKLDDHAELRNKSALVVQTSLRRRAAVKRVHREKVRSKGQMLPWKRTIANGDGWYMETNPNDGSDILIWCRRLPKWEIVFGPFPVSFVEDLIKQARISQKEEGGVGIAPLPGTQYGGSGTYIDTNGDTAKYLVVTRGSLKQNDLVSDWVKVEPEYEKSASVISRQLRRNKNKRESLVPVFRTKSSDRKGWFLDRTTNLFAWYENAEGSSSSLVVRHGPFRPKDVMRALNDSKRKQQKGDTNVSVSLAPVAEDGDVVLVDYAGNVLHAKSLAAEHIQEQIRKNKNRKQLLVPVLLTSPTDQEGWFLNKSDNKFAWYEATERGRILKFGPFVPQTVMRAWALSKTRRDIGQADILVRITPVARMYSKKIGDDVYVDCTGNVQHAKTLAATRIQEQARKRKLKKEQLLPVFSTKRGDPAGWFLHKPSKLFAWYHTLPPPLGRQVKFGPFEQNAVMLAMNESKSRSKNGEGPIPVLLMPVPKHAKMVYVDYTGSIKDAKNYAAERIQEQSRKRIKRKQQLVPTFRTKEGDEKGWFVNQIDGLCAWYEIGDAGLQLTFGPFVIRAAIRAMNESKNRSQRGETDIFVLLGSVYVDFSGHVKDAKPRAAACIQEHARRREMRKQRLVPVLHTKQGDGEGWFVNRADGLFAWYETIGDTMAMTFGPFEKPAVMQAMHESKTRHQNNEVDISVRLVPVKGGGDVAFVDYIGGIRDGLTPITVASSGGEMVNPEKLLEERMSKAATLVQKRYRKFYLNKEGMMITVFGTLQGVSGWYSDHSGKIAAWFNITHYEGSDPVWACTCGPFPYAKVQKAIFRSRVAQMEKTEGGRNASLVTTNIPGQFTHSVDHKGNLHKNTPADLFLGATGKEHKAARVLQNRLRHHRLKKAGIMLPIFDTVQGPPSPPHPRLQP
jgi:hypothetical protein